MTIAHVILNRRPVGEPGLADFRLEERALPAPGAGEVRLRLHYLSIDPYMVMVTRGEGVYIPVLPGGPMIGRAVARVVESKAPGFAPGEWVLGFMPWAEEAVLPASALVRLDPAKAPLPAYLGTVGHSGMTAWLGIVETAQVGPGDTVLVTAASGAVGSVAGQIARIQGARVIGIAGGQAKQRHVIDDLGFDACLDHRQPGWTGQLDKLLADMAPDGASVLFENVGGDVFDQLLPRMRRHGRVALCGLAAHYGNTEPVRLANFREVLQRQLRLEGFTIGDHLHRRDEIVSQLADWVSEGSLKHFETLIDGLDQAPAALVALLAGDKIGKLVVRLAEPA